MRPSEDTTNPYQALPHDVAGAVNLMAHPLASAAAMGAIGFAMAGHAVGLWLGAVAGAAEASHRMLNALPEADAEPQPAAGAKLKLVVSKPTPRKVSVKAASVKPDAAGPVRVRPQAMTKPAAPDDLKAIAGIGPKLEKVLNDLGIWTYAQVVALGEAEIAWLDDHLGFAGRIGRDDWVGQARALSGAA